LTTKRRSSKAELDDALKLRLGQLQPAQSSAASLRSNLQKSYSEAGSNAASYAGGTWISQGRTSLPGQSPRGDGARKALDPLSAHSQVVSAMGGAPVDAQLRAGNAGKMSGSDRLTQVHSQASLGLPAVFNRSEHDNISLGAGFHSVGEVESRYWASERDRVHERNLNAHLLRERGLVEEDEGIVREAESRYASSLLHSPVRSASGSQLLSIDAASRMGQSAVAAATQQLHGDGPVFGDPDDPLVTKGRGVNSASYLSDPMLPTGIADTNPAPNALPVRRPIPDLEPGGTQVTMPSPPPKPLKKSTSQTETAYFRPRHAVSPSVSAVAAAQLASGASLNPYGRGVAAPNEFMKSPSRPLSRNASAAGIQADHIAVPPLKLSEAIEPHISAPFPLEPKDTSTSARGAHAPISFHAAPAYLPNHLSGSKTPVRLPTHV